ncbi:hypothetical protein BpHYR1_041507 [Brachionus plicatilis]|uniref:Uncharacterized protein n=1 Tax=Brachionus plicatilis TaxID=10195 RepID=A0A3M7T043_BRAPC|nr:hypothetical protein BpHYR1_041507 [Brachionus plicatilis]
MYPIIRISYSKQACGDDLLGGHLCSVRRDLIKYHSKKKKFQIRWTIFRLGELIVHLTDKNFDHHNTNPNITMGIMYRILDKLLQFNNYEFNDSDKAAEINKKYDLNNEWKIQDIPKSTHLNSIEILCLGAKRVGE